MLGRDRAWLYAHPEEIVSALDAHRFVSLIARRADGEPSQYLTGKQEFWGLEFEVTRDVLIPRPKPSTLSRSRSTASPCEKFVQDENKLSLGTDSQIVDIGTGSGCIAIALAKEASRLANYCDRYFRGGPRRRPTQRNAACVGEYPVPRIKFARLPPGRARHAVPLLGETLTADAASF